MRSLQLFQQMIVLSAQFAIGFLQTLRVGLVVVVLQRCGDHLLLEDVVLDLERVQFLGDVHAVRLEKKYI